MKNFLRCPTPILLLLALIILPEAALATHIRAGEITARRADAQSLDYEITLKIYADRGSQVVIGSNGFLDFGDGEIRALTNNGDPTHPNYIPRTAISADTWLYELKLVHRYPSAGSYLINYTERFRNEGILNMDNSLNLPFYIETSLVIDLTAGSNSTPVFSSPPIDKAYVGKTYHHQPGGSDRDGDSLAYKLVSSKQSKTTPVSFYRFPHMTFPAGDPAGGTNETGGAPILYINPRTGDIVWDAPGTAGEYNLTFIVEEWRKIGGRYWRLGYVMRDMQIIVEDSEALQPELEFPIDENAIAPPAGQSLSWTITAVAPSPEEEVVLEIWGDFLGRTNAVASASRVQAQGQASITISWTGEADQGQNYQLLARSYVHGRPQITRNRSAFIYSNGTVLGLQPQPLAAVKVFPNPLKGQHFHISMPEAAGKEVSLQLYELSGRLVLQEKGRMLAETYPLQLKDPKPGIYLLRLHYNGLSYQQRLVVE